METMRELVERLQKVCELCPDNEKHLAHRTCELCERECCKAHAHKCRCGMWQCDDCYYNDKEHDEWCKSEVSSYPPNGGVAL